jgi:hypothetical protein
MIFGWKKQINRMKFNISVLLLMSCLYFTPQVQAKTLCVSKTGNDANPGTETAPFLTINKAAQLAVAGDIVFVNEGVYRETVKPQNSGADEERRIVYMAKPGAKVVIKGSEEINTWKRYKNKVWRVTLPNTFFGDYNPYSTQHPFWDGGKFFEGYTCGDVYLNEEAYCQKDTLEKLQTTPNTWYAEVNENYTTIYANFGSANPNKELAEINVRHQCFAPDVWGLAYITVDGFTVMHAANWYSDFPSPVRRRQAGAISVNGGLKWIIQNNTVINARSIGIDIGLGCDNWAGYNPEITRTNYWETEKYGSHILRNNYIAKCGQSGIAGVFSWNSQILNNQIEDNNYRNEFSGAETAPIKLHYCNYGLIKGNYIHNSQGWNSAGIWTDWGNQGMRITGNIVINCPSGYYGEAVHGPILVDNNIFIGNHEIRVSDATGILFAHNLFVDNKRVFVHGKGRECAYYEPGTMNIKGALSFPQLFYWFNNVFADTTFPQNEEGKTHLQAGNDTTAISHFQYTATSQEMTISFDYHPSLSERILPVTKERIGIIPKANERIPVDVDTDFFDRPIVENSIRTGPFQNIKPGRNTFNLWHINLLQHHKDK